MEYDVKTEMIKWKTTSFPFLNGKWHVTTNTQLQNSHHLRIVGLPRTAYLCEAYIKTMNFLQNCDVHVIFSSPPGERIHVLAIKQGPQLFSNLVAAWNSYRIDELYVILIWINGQYFF